MGIEKKEGGLTLDDKENQQIDIRADLYEPKTYKQSLWSELIDVSQEASEVTNDQKLAEWVDWMKKEGFRLPGNEIADKMVKLGLVDE